MQSGFVGKIEFDFFCRFLRLQKTSATDSIVAVLELLPTHSATIMLVMSDLTQTITEQAAQSHQIMVDGQMVTNRPLNQLIEADRYLASKQAQTNKRQGFGLMFQKIVPPAGG